MNVNCAGVSPCKECGSRIVGCHDTCTKYNIWIEAQQQAKNKRIATGDVDSQFHQSLRKSYPLKGKGASK